MPSLRLLPHGYYTLIPTVFSTVAWLAALSQDGCNYARLTGFIVAETTESTSVPFLQVGFNAYRQPSLVNGDWTVDSRSTCLAYNTDVFTIDAYWKAAKGFAFIALVCGGGGALFLWFSSCFVFSKGTWKWAGYEVLSAAVFQSLAFLWFATYICREGDSVCMMSYGSKANIASAVLWFVSALVIFRQYPAPKQMHDQMEEEIRHHVADVQYGGEGTSETPPDEFIIEVKTMDLPVEGDVDAIILVDQKKGNETVVQAMRVDADLL